MKQIEAMTWEELAFHCGLIKKQADEAYAEVRRYEEEMKKRAGQVIERARTTGETLEEILK